MQPIVERAREAGATFLGGVALHLRDEVKDVFFAWLEAKRPDLLPRYEELYTNNRAYLPASERSKLTRKVWGWGRSSTARDAPRAGGAVGGTSPEEASATAGRGGSPAATGPARQDRLF